LFLFWLVGSGCAVSDPRARSATDFKDSATHRQTDVVQIGPVADQAPAPDRASASVVAVAAPTRALPAGPQPGDPFVSTLSGDPGFDLFALDASQLMLPAAPKSKNSIATPAVGTHHTKEPVCRCGKDDEIAIRGRLPPEVVRRTIHLNYGRFRACYQEGLRRRGPTLQGLVSTRFVIRADGTVKSSSNVSTELADADTVRCITNAFAAIEFPPPGNDGEVTVVYPLALKSENAP
jgi:hypothetical protein